MTTQGNRASLERRYGKTVRVALRCSVALGLFALCGCTFMDNMMAREAKPEDRTLLTSQGFVSLQRREIDDYTCAEDVPLVCERAAGSAFTCSCTRR